MKLVCGLFAGYSICAAGLEVVVQWCFKPDCELDPGALMILTSATGSDAPEPVS